MKLYLLTQNECKGYDTYSSAVVAAPDEDAARKTHPGDRNLYWGYAPEWYRSVEPDEGWFSPSGFHDRSDSWPSPNHVKAQYIGEAADGVAQGIICASFHAG